MMVLAAMAYCALSPLMVAAWALLKAATIICETRGEGGEGSGGQRRMIR